MYLNTLVKALCPLLGNELFRGQVMQYIHLLTLDFR